MKKLRSKFEYNFVKLLKANNIDFSYEAKSFPYQQVRHYTPDFQLTPTLYVETKGLWTGADRTKHKLFREQHPDITIIMVFQDPNRKLSKSSKQTYADYCKARGWPWCSYNPQEFIELIKKEISKNL